MEETILVECSRQSSIEGTTQNFTTEAEWTCECGDGIVVDIGDKIQVHSGFVSEKGAQAGEIEIKERDRGESMLVEVSKDIKYSIPFEYHLPDTPSESVGLKQRYDFQMEEGGNHTIPIEINDGETNVIYSPYKTANGEYYITLPRRHVGVAEFAKTHNLAPFNTLDANDGPFISGHNLGAGVMGNIMYQLDGEAHTLAHSGNNFTEAWQFNPNDYKLMLPQGANTYSGSLNRTHRKGLIKNDNSRYTIFRAKKIYRSKFAAFEDTGEYIGNLSPMTPDAVGSAGWFDAFDKRDPATLLEWEQVRELVKLSSKTGFNKPQDVSVELSQQLNLRSEEKSRSLISRVDTHGMATQNVMYKYYESPCYKAYSCAGSHFDKDAFEKFKRVDTTTGNVGDVLDTAHQYLSQYQHIGVKRPELFIQGRKTNGSQGFLKTATGDGRNTPTNAECLNLGLEWTDANLNKLNDLFKVQGQYPELFSSFDERAPLSQQGPHTPPGRYYTIDGVDKHRFLHFNKQDEQNTAVHQAANIYRHNPKNSLGYDLYGHEGHNLPSPNNDRHTYDNTMASYPIFFDFNSDLVNNSPDDVGYCEDGGGGVSNINDLAYGWARKMRVDPTLSVSGEEKFYIGIQFTRTGNGVPEFLYNGLSHIALSSIPGNTGRRFGWDYHFSAYGNPCMILYSGLVNANSFTTNIGQFCYDEFSRYRAAISVASHTGNIRDIAPMYNQIFLGADEPVIGYDTTEERFFFSNLHMSERGGNPSNAGQVEHGSNPEVDTVPTADDRCYKINKRMLGNNYCPNVAPYTDASIRLAAESVYPEQLKMSENLEPFIPYDAMGGIFIEEIVVKEDIWDENLIGVLGFEYSQFNNDNVNRQISITDRLNSNNVSSLTTQAPIRVDDLVSWTKNGYGNNTYDIGHGKVMARRIGTTHQGQSLYPPATIFLADGDNSTKITALNLPTKTARPYYSIRSDIIPQSQFIGGNQDLTRATAGAVNRPVVAIVNKVNGYGDFYTGAENQVVFTNTEKRVITAIKTSIHDPDGSYAKVDKSSSVIYKIIKDKQIDLTPLKTLLESKRKADQLMGQQVSSMLKNIENENPNFNFALQGLQQPDVPIPMEETLSEEQFFAARSSV